MDAGWAVVLGAFIALAGSSLIPWLRDSLTEKRLAAERSATRRRKALVDLLAANAGMAASLAAEDNEATRALFEARSRAAAGLLLEADEIERPHLLPLLNRSVPVDESHKDGGASPGQKIYALQNVLISWAAGELSVGDLAALYTVVLRSAPEPGMELPEAG